MSRFRYVKQHLDVAHHARFQDFLKSSVHTTTHGSSAVRALCARSRSRTDAPAHRIRPCTHWPGLAAKGAACGSPTRRWKHSDDMPHTSDDNMRQNITYMRSDTRRRAPQSCFAACGHRTHRPDQPRGLRGLPPDEPSRTAHTTSTQPKRAQAARTRPSPCDIEHRRDGLQGRRCAR